MRTACLCVLLVTALAAIGGCDGDDNQGTMLSQGTANLAGSGEMVLATVNCNAPGTLRGTIAWSGDPTELVVAFKHVVPGDVIGLTIGASPSSTTVAVTSARVAAGTQWEFIGANSSGTAVSVTFEVTFEAE